jgi:hypothetical protein
LTANSQENIKQSLMPFIFADDVKTDSNSKSEKDTDDDYMSSGNPDSFKKLGNFLDGQDPTEIELELQSDNQIKLTHTYSIELSDE